LQAGEIGAKGIVMKTLGAVCLFIMALAAVPGVAQAQWAYTSASVHVRAGPAPDYPVVAILPPRFQVMVHGCLGDYSWCDVSVGWDRGWVYGAYIYYPYRGRDVPVIHYGAQIGFAIFGFVLYDYWADHYRQRPFYHERERWVRRYPPPPPPRAAPRVQRPPPPPPKSAPQVQRRPQPEPPGMQRPPPPQQRAPEMQRPPPQRAPDIDRRQPPQKSAPQAQRPQPPHGGPGK
jgi:uncharacterized protein YraI